MRVLVTGGAGYIGSHAAKQLAHAGFEPVTFDNLSTGNRSAVRWGPFVKGDLADSDCLRKAIRQYEVEAVMHFAASAYVGESMLNPRKYFENNVVNSLKLLDAMLDTGTRHLVFSSSCATYGVPSEVPVTEESLQLPINPYGESKLFVENALRWYSQAHPLNWVALRYFNAAGADPEGELGEEHEPETHLIPLVVHAALGKRSHVDIYGTDYPTSDGTAIRDYVHVSDLADAHVLALKYLIDEGHNCAINLSANRGYSIRQVIDAVERISGQAIEVREESRRSGDPAILVGNARLAREILGWHAQRSGLDSIIRTAWAWQRGGAQNSL